MVTRGGDGCKTGLRIDARAVVCCALFGICRVAVEIRVRSAVCEVTGAGPARGWVPDRSLTGWRRLAAAGGVLCLLLAALPARAALVELLVDAAGEEEATAIGLEEALLRVAGVRSPALSGLVDPMRGDRERPWLLARERRGPERFLLAFDRARLRTALQDAAVPVWVGSRPALLVWVVLERGDRRLLLGSGMDEDAVLTSLRDWSGRREWPLLFPLGDLEDRRQVRIADVVGGVTEALEAPGRRYDPDGLLLLHLAPRGDRMRAQAWLSYRGYAIQTEASEATAAAAAREAVASSIDELGARLARVLADEALARVGFTGVAGMGELQALRARLVALEAVQSAQISRLHPGAVVLELHTGLDPTALAEVLAGEGFAVTDAPPEGSDTTLWFRRVR